MATACLPRQQGNTQFGLHVFTVGAEDNTQVVENVAPVDPEFFRTMQLYVAKARTMSIVMHRCTAKQAYAQTVLIMLDCQCVLRDGSSSNFSACQSFTP